MPCFDTFNLEFEKTIVIFEIITLELVHMQSVAQNKRNSDLARKIPYLGIFRMIFEITIVIVCYYHVTYKFQSESTLYSCLNVKELPAGNRRQI